MTVPLYDVQETNVAIEALRTISRSLPEPFLLIGGWAVYLTVNESFSKAHGTSYLGSRDIDVCFHVDPGQDIDTLRGSTFARALEVVKKEGKNRVMVAGIANKNKMGMQSRIQGISKILSEKSGISKG